MESVVRSLVETIREDLPAMYDYETLVKVVEDRVRAKEGRGLTTRELAAIAEGWRAVIYRNQGGKQ